MAKIKELFSKYWDDILKPVVVLLGICIVIPLALAVTDSVTKEKIAEGIGNYDPEGLTAPEI